MREVAYVFERFPSFGQTFCYREVVELERQGVKPRIFSIRRPINEPAQDWAPDVVDRVEYLPDEPVLVPEVDRLLRKDKSLATVRGAIENWGRQSDFLRLYQAAYIGQRLRAAGIRHAHAHFAGMAARTVFWLREFFEISYSFTAHANDVFAPRPFAVGLDQLMRRAAAVVAVSDFGADFLRQNYAPDAGKVHRIYNGIDLSAFPAAEFTSVPARIISVGRLIEKKGFADLVAACAELKEAGCDFTCEIVGEGPLEDALRAQIFAYTLEDRVHLVGPQTQAQIARRFVAATVFALPCTTEKDGGMDNLPTVIMEAMAAGLPIVSTTVAGVPEMVRDQVTGRLVSPGDVAALTRALREFLTDSTHAQGCGARGRELARERFSIASSVRSLITLFGSTT